VSSVHFFKDKSPSFISLFSRSTWS